MTDLKDRKNAMLHIAEERRGTKDVLIETIGVELFNQFCRMGFIKKGVSTEKKNPVSTWQITEQGEKQTLFYRNPTCEEKVLGQIYYALGI